MADFQAAGDSIAYCIVDATLPLYFSDEDIEILNSIDWDNILPDYGNYPTSFKEIFRVYFHQLYIIKIR